MARILFGISSPDGCSVPLIAPGKIVRRAARIALVYIAVEAILLFSLNAFPTVPARASLGGFFSITCPFSHSNHDDPIVFPGVPHATHLHDYYGNRSVNYSSTPDSLVEHPETTCKNAGDRSGYWTPSPKMGSDYVKPPFQNEYWFDASFQTVETVPFGMELVAGDAHATGEQPTGHVYYYCGNGSPRKARPYDCAPYGTQITMVAVFPQCWDGELPAGNDTAHVAYRTNPGVCPPGFPHVLVTLEEHIHTGITSPFDAQGNFVFSLSSGAYYTLHGDFMNAWDPAILDEFVDDCINAHVHCGADTPP